MIALKFLFGAAIVVFMIWSVGATSRRIGRHARGETAEIRIIVWLFVRVPILKRSVGEPLRTEALNATFRQALRG
jgi:hypothetical protein